MRERGSEGIACPKGCLYPLNGYPNIVHRPIGRFVVSGRGRRWLLSLGRLLSPSSRACLSSFRLAVRFARSHSTSFRLRPAVGYPEQRRSGFRLRGSSTLIPVRSSVAWGDKKRRTTHQWGSNAGSSNQRRFQVLFNIFLVSLPLIRMQR